MKKEIKYIGFYDVPGAKYPRASCLAATDKMDYVCDALNRAGYRVHLISPSWFKDSDAPFQGSTTSDLKEKIRLTTAPSFGAKRKPLRLIRIVLSLLWLFFYLVKNTRRNEKILAYHAPWLSLPIRLAKRMRGFLLMLEVEEIYGNVWSLSKRFKCWERKLIKSADSLIAVSDLLADQLGPRAKTILYGNYQVSDRMAKPLTESGCEIRLVYAGSIDSTKGGAIKAIECLRYLPGNYVLHICGYGGKHEIMNMQEFLKNTNCFLNRTACIYHGVLTGSDFSDLLSSCHIALNPQVTGDYMLTAFPSKVIKYLSYNLPVVTTPISSIIKSPLASSIVFSIDDTPEAIAKAIRTIDPTKSFISSVTLKQMDQKFINDIGSLIEDGEND